MRPVLVLIVFFSEKVVNLMARRQPLDADQRMALMIPVSFLFYLFLILGVIGSVFFAAEQWFMR